jgi:hypothetical protein
MKSGAGLPTAGSIPVVCMIFPFNVISDMAFLLTVNVITDVVIEEVPL